ncbi:MAG: helicase-related protein [Candidatus Enteromonas sp.]|nr:helicase-related protein [Candidatus Enteromonas sp.]
MGTSFVCPRCGNSDPRFLGHKNGEVYCRKCISFRGEEALEKKVSPKNVVLSLDYRLSKEQETLSKQIIENYDKGIDTLVYAVCGSGKTEISYGIIARSMARGLRVGFALPRRDVVIELYYRLKSAFPHNSIVAVYGGNTTRLEGDCIILTTHQLYRYPNYFDLLVMDEIDAFPFKGNDVLIAMYKRSLKGHCVMMSATPSEAVIKEFQGEGHAILELRTRFHKHPIPVPKTITVPSIFQLLFVIRRLRVYGKEGKPCLIFVPTVEDAELLFQKLSMFVKGGDYVSSKRRMREAIISKFKKGGYSYLVTTAVLERGVTVKGVQVVVYGADDPIYDSAALIQIAGRVGRKKGAEDGDVFFLAKEESKSMRKAIKEIQFCNTFL